MEPAVLSGTDTNLKKNYGISQDGCRLEKIVKVRGILGLAGRTPDRPNSPGLIHLTLLNQNSTKHPNL